jgi:hypothetical protein
MISQWRETTGAGSTHRVPSAGSARRASDRRVVEELDDFLSQPSLKDCLHLRESCARPRPARWRAAMRRKYPIGRRTFNKTLSRSGEIIAQCASCRW